MSYVCLFFGFYFLFLVTNGDVCLQIIERAAADKALRDVDAALADVQRRRLAGEGLVSC